MEQRWAVIDVEKALYLLSAGYSYDSIRSLPAGLTGLRERKYSRGEFKISIVYTTPSFASVSLTATGSQEELNKLEASLIKHKLIPVCN